MKKLLFTLLSFVLLTACSVSADEPNAQSVVFTHHEEGLQVELVYSIVEGDVLLDIEVVENSNDKFLMIAQHTDQELVYMQLEDTLSYTIVGLESIEQIFEHESSLTNQSDFEWSLIVSGGTENMSYFTTVELSHSIYTR